MSSKNRGFLESIVETVKGWFGGGERDAPPEPPPEVVMVDPVEETDLETEEEFFEEEEIFEEEFEEEEEDFEADDFEEFLLELETEEEDGERVIEVTTMREFISAGGDVKRLRKVRYVSEEEAREFLESAGLAGFSEVFYDENSDTYGIAVYDSPGATAK